jgi:hypothetical protein
MVYLPLLAQKLWRTLMLSAPLTGADNIGCWLGPLFNFIPGVLFNSGVLLAANVVHAIS